MNKSRVLSAALAGLLCASAPLAATAAVFTFNAGVFDSPGPAATPGEPDFPPLLTDAQVELFIDDSDPSLELDPSMASSLPEGWVSASINIPGYLSGSMSYDPGEGFDIGTDFYFAAYGPSILEDPGSFSFLDEGLHSIRIFFSDIPSTPSTVGELVAAVSKPGIHGVFSFEATGDDTPEQFYDVEVKFPPPIIPLPATVVLFASAFAGLATFRVGNRSRAKSKLH